MKNSLVAACVVAACAPHAASPSPTQALRGHFEKYVWPAGTKLEGETTLHFVADGGHVFLFANPPSSPPSGEVTIHAHAVTLSPTDAHVDGDYLWLDP